MSDYLRAPGGTRDLFPLQAAALYELWRYKGLFAGLRVGGGKTLISLLAAEVMQAQAPMLILPAELIARTRREMIDNYGPHWKLPPNLNIVSYESFGTVDAERELFRLSPDMMIFDEGHKVKSMTAARTMRLDRYIAAYRPIVVWMTGTFIRKSLKDFAHCIGWTHGVMGQRAGVKIAHMGIQNIQLERLVKHDWSPVPQEPASLIEWCEALDHRVGDDVRRAPGVLVDLAPVAHDPAATETDQARRAFYRRMSDTPGVIMSRGKGVECSISIRFVKYSPPDTTKAMIKKLRDEWETPDGWHLSGASEVWMHQRQLALGFHSIWNPRPPELWRTRRAAWKSFVRDTVARTHLRLDSEKPVMLAVQNHELDDGGLLAEWKAIEPTFVPNPEDVWHDDKALQVAASWAKKHHGIIWVEHVFFGRKLASMTGLPYYGQQGLNELGEPIESERGTRSVIASVKANSTGRNLQHAFSHNLITCLSPSCDVAEQLIGRTHREGQEADTVVVDIMHGTSAVSDAFREAIESARMTRDIGGDVPKLLLADVVN